MVSIAKIVACGLIAGSFFGIGYGVNACVPEKNPDYSELKVANGYYQNADIELEKAINNNNELEIYLKDEGIRIQLKDDLLLGDNNSVYSGLENRIKKNPKKNEDIIDSMLEDAYNLKLKANEGNKVKENCVSPSDIAIKYNETSEGDYLSIENKLTNEVLPITKDGGFIGIGGIDYQYNHFKEKAIDKASQKYDSFMDKIRSWIPLFGG